MPRGLCRHGVFRRRLGLTPGAKPVQLSFLVCSEKDEKLSGMDVLKVPVCLYPLSDTTSTYAYNSLSIWL